MAGRPQANPMCFCLHTPYAAHGLANKYEFYREVEKMVLYHSLEPFQGLYLIWLFGEF